jgi:hypothetical protein
MNTDFKMKRIMKHRKIILLIIWVLISNPVVQAQTAPVDWQGKISIGGNTTRIHCPVLLKETGKLYLSADTLLLSGNFTGETGSKLFFPAYADRYGFMHVSGTITGDTEFIPDISPAWDGSQTDLLKAQKGLTGANAFFIDETGADCNGYAAFLGQRNEEKTAVVWYLYGTPVLPLIVPLARHTLVANNNRTTNGGYRFLHYTWYKDGQSVKEGSHEEHGGSYYTGGADLDPAAEYTVKVVDDKGKVYFSCPYRYLPLPEAVNVSVYPNPVARNTKANIRVETGDVALLNQASVEMYDLQGQYIGKMNLAGQAFMPLDLPSKPGVYILKFRAKEYVKTLKVMVE